VALAMHHRLSRSRGSRPVSVSLITRELLPTHPRGVRRRVERVLQAAGIALLRARKLVEVRADAVRVADGEPLPMDLTVWATGASAPSWLARSPLATDARGFLSVDATLRSTSHPSVLAAGDIASLSPRSVPKAGIFAVRQGPVLAENLVRLLRDEAPSSYAPQHRCLSLISLGQRRAIASWGPCSAEGAWVWWLKDRIDRTFMSRYAGGDGSGRSIGPTQAPQVFS
jgi:selenide, water dikinase